MPEETAGFLHIAGDKVTPAGDVSQLRIFGHKLVVATSGLGKVNAAMTAATILERFDCKSLVSAGTAGALQDFPGPRVIVGTELIQHDYGRSRGHGLMELYRPGIPPLPQFADVDFAFRQPASRIKAWEPLLRQRDDIQLGCYASGDTFVNDAATRKRLTDLGAIAVDMECAAVAQVAEHHGIPWLVAKGISDGAGDESHNDFLEGLVAASRHSAEVVAALLPELLRNH